MSELNLINKTHSDDLGIHYHYICICGPDLKGFILTVTQFKLLLMGYNIEWDVTPA